VVAERGEEMKIEVTECGEECEARDRAERHPRERREERVCHPTVSLLPGNELPHRTLAGRMDAYSRRRDATEHREAATAELSLRREIVR